MPKSGTRSEHSFTTIRFLEGAETGTQNLIFEPEKNEGKKCFFYLLFAQRTKLVWDYEKNRRLKGFI